MPAMSIKWNGFNRNESISCVVDVEAGSVLSPPNVVGNGGAVRREGKDAGEEIGDS